jgi:hypothetical protein
MELLKFKELYERNNLHYEYEQAKNLLLMLENEFQDIDLVDEVRIDEFIAYLVSKKMNLVENFIVLMRYYRVIGNNDIYIHLTRYTGMLDVVETILKRAKSMVEKSSYEQIIKDYKLPFLGMSPSQLPGAIDELMKRLDENLNDDLVKKVLTGNNHNLSEKSQLREKIEYERHERKVKELESHLLDKTPWFEQTITEEVVDFVRSNQEVLSAKLENDKLYITKIPYDTVSYLNATDEITRKYFGCHCPFAREAIKNGELKLDERFCYCSAGFAKFPFEIILNQKLPIKVLKSILAGDDICRFEIDLRAIEYKK